MKVINLVLLLGISAHKNLTQLTNKSVSHYNCQKLNSPSTHPTTFLTDELVNIVKQLNKVTDKLCIRKCLIEIKEADDLILHYMLQYLIQIIHVKETSSFMIV